MTTASTVYDCTDAAVLPLILDETARRIGAGELIVMPTDTVYGIAADAFDHDAVERLLHAKGRGRAMPPPVLIGHAGALDGLAAEVPPFARAMAERLWPGGLTLILQAQPSLDWDLSETHGTVALRMPDHPVALDLLRRTGPLAVSSANRSGSPAAGEITAAREMLGDVVGIYLDAGPVTGGEASTIVDATVVPPRVVRAGAVALEALRELAPDLQTVEP